MMQTDRLSVEFSHADCRIKAEKPIIFRGVNILFLFLYVFQPSVSKLSITHALTLYMAMVILYDIFAKSGRKFAFDRDAARHVYVFLPFIIYVTVDYFVQSFISSMV